MREVAIGNNVGCVEVVGVDSDVGWAVGIFVGTNEEIAVGNEVGCVEVLGVSLDVA